MTPSDDVTHPDNPHFDIRRATDQAAAMATLLERSSEAKTRGAEIQKAVADLSADVRKVGSDLDAVKAEVAVLRERVAPLQRLVYGCVGLLLTGIIGGMLYLIIKHP